MCPWRVTLFLTALAVVNGAKSPLKLDREHKPWKYYPWKGQFQQDQKLAEHVFRNKKDGYFIELGAADGLTLSNTYAFEVARNWSGLLIDFFEDPRCHVNRPGSKCLAACVAGVEETRLVHLSGLTSALVTLKDLEEDAGKREIHCKTLPHLLEQNKAPQHIDWLSLDVEGAELEILQPLLRSDFMIDVITIETLQENKENYTRFMLNNGYYFLDRFGLDNAFVKEWTEEETFCKEVTKKTSLRRMLHTVLDMLTGEDLLERLNRHMRNVSVLRLNRTAEVARRQKCKMAEASLHLARSLFLRKELFFQEACVGTAFDGEALRLDTGKVPPVHFDKCGPFFALSLSRMRFINAVQSDWPIFRLLYVFSQKLRRLMSRHDLDTFHSECPALGFEIFESRRFDLGRQPKDLRRQGMVCGVFHNAVRWLQRAKTDGLDVPKRFFLQIWQAEVILKSLPLDIEFWEFLTIAGYLDENNPWKLLADLQEMWHKKTEQEDGSSWSIPRFRLSDVW